MGKGAGITGGEGKKEEGYEVVGRGRKEEGYEVVGRGRKEEGYLSKKCLP